MRIAIMQPYFMPYTGYFRLFASTDLFVVYDCVQFIRRGWIHRNRLPNTNHILQWLTLPLQKAPQETIIKDMHFADDAQTAWDARLKSFSHVLTPQFLGSNLGQSLHSLDEIPITYLVKLLASVCKFLQLPCNMVHSSTINLPENIRNEERILAIAKYYNATHYINLSGGKALYCAERFKQHGIQLAFLKEYDGPYTSILERLIKEDHQEVKQDIFRQSMVD